MTDKPTLLGTAAPVILTPFGAYEATIRGINAQCDERQAAIGESAKKLADAIDLVEGQRAVALNRAFADYQAALKALN